MVYLKQMPIKATAGSILYLFGLGLGQLMQSISHLRPYSCLLPNVAAPPHHCKWCQILLMLTSELEADIKVKCKLKTAKRAAANNYGGVLLYFSFLSKGQSNKASLSITIKAGPSCLFLLCLSLGVSKETWEGLNAIPS